MPGSKSHVNRALIAATLSDGRTTITGITPFDDVQHMVNGLQTLGFNVQWTDESKSAVDVQGGLPAESPDEDSKELFCGNAGTAVRFLTSLACLVPGSWTITGDEHMQKRPIQPLIDALRELGAEIEATDGCPPIHIKGGGMGGGEISLDASKSSQYLTSLLLVGPALSDGLTINLTSELTSPTYIELTNKVMRDFGIDTSAFTIPKSAKYTSPDACEIEGDWSAASAFLCLAEATKSRIRFTNLHHDSLQGDRKVPSVIQEMRQDGELTIDCTDFPDQVMNLCVLAAKRNGVTNFRGAANLRLKECDRIGVTVTELKKAGLHIEEHEDGITVTGPTENITPVRLDPHHDHRMAFCYAVLGSLADGIEIQDAHCVSKTYPHFFDDLQKLHNSPRCIALVGMRACGKSQLAKKLAKTLNLKHFDTDDTFERQAGPIGEFVEKHGWETFREGEEIAVKECLQPGNVVSLGGGAIESETTRSLLDKEAITIWMYATPAFIVQRLKETDRPALTDLPLEKEVQETMQRRDPLYEKAADITLPNDLRYAEQIPFLQQELQNVCSL